MGKEGCMYGVCFCFRINRKVNKDMEVKRGMYRNTVWAGASYRMDDAVGFTVGYMFQQNLMFGYSYDMPTSSIQNYTSGTHELMLGIRFRQRMANEPSEE